MISILSSSGSSEHETRYPQDSLLMRNFILEADIHCSTDDYQDGLRGSLIPWTTWSTFDHPHRNKIQRHRPLTAL